MQKIFLFLLFVVPGITSFSQQGFFIYLQADNAQPFYARINTKLYSSTENGYMIIPKLGDSVYSVRIGFARNAFPEQNFSISINKKDKGFQLKNLGEKGWALVNLQNLSVIMNEGLPVKSVSEFSGIKKTNVFSEMLAYVVNDSSILYSSVKITPSEPVTAKPIPVPGKPVDRRMPDNDSLQSAVAIIQPSVKEPVKLKDSLPEAPGQLTKSTSTIAPSPLKTVIDSNITDSSKVTNQVSAQTLPPEKPFITRIKESKTEQEYQAIYIEQYNLSTDTIRISIPFRESAGINTGPVTPVNDKKTEPVPVPNILAGEKASSPELLPADTSVSVKKVIQLINSDCKGLATDYDVDKLRVKLINDKTIDDKLATSKKYYKTKCLSVKQITALAELFPTDETKVRFFDTSYPFVSDTSNYYLLAELIETTYYKNRFKAIIQK